MKKLCALIISALLLSCNREQPSTSYLADADINVKKSPINELQWLIGRWADAEPDIDITFDNQWDKSHHFIVRHFSMKQKDEKNLEGVEIIGWDSSTNNIHSWIFDSDGGFGESEWQNEEGNWHVNLLFTRPDGKKATALNTYKVEDQNTYFFSSINRDLDGEFLPNIGPYKVVRRS